jgi:hypothetical protein
VDLEQRKTRGVSKLSARPIAEFPTGCSEQNYTILVLDTITDRRLGVTLGPEGEEGFIIGDILVPQSDRALGSF